MANCTAFNNTQNPELEAYATCLNAESKFFYTITFLLIPLIFYLTEFLTLRDEYEPTGLRSKIVVSKKNLEKSEKKSIKVRYKSWRFSGPFKICCENVTCRKMQLFAQPFNRPIYLSSGLTKRFAPHQAAAPGFWKWWSWSLYYLSLWLLWLYGNPSLPSSNSTVMACK